MLQTTFVLRWIVYADFALAGAVLACFFVVSHLTRGSAPGWTSIAAMLLLTGFSIASSDVVGLHVGQTFEQVKQRPLYVISERTERARPIGPAGTPDREIEPSAPPR